MIGPQIINDVKVCTGCEYLNSPRDFNGVRQQYCTHPKFMKKVQDELVRPRGKYIQPFKEGEPIPPWCPEDK